MTAEELMALADAYARAAAAFHLTPSDESAERLAAARNALVEALEITSQFGGI